MARSLFYKEKVALSTLLIFCSICVAQSQSRAQSTSSLRFDKISYSCHATRLETVIDFLSKQTGYDFIYSRSLVDISKPVSITAKEQSINEILSQLERQADVSFKLKDNHIVVKSNPKRATVPTQTNIARRSGNRVELPGMKLNDGPLLTSTNRMFSLRPIESETKILANQLDRRINEVQSLLGPNVPRTIPQYDISQINFNSRHRGWFAAAGAYAGDNSTGIELQAGLPYAYAVFDPKWSATKGFTPSFGVGNSFALTGNFSFNTIYMYSSYSKTETLTPFANPRGQAGPELHRKQDERQHQVKFLVQYSFSKTISVRVGPVLNYHTVQTQMSVVSTNAAYETMPIGHQYGSTTYQNSQFGPAPKISRISESWVGWDASVIYRINFYEHK
jgi:hypothetical protein